MRHGALFIPVCFCPVFLIRWKRRKEQRGRQRQDSLLFETAFQRPRSSKLSAVSFSSPGPTPFPPFIGKKYRMEAQHGWPLASRRAASRERVGGVCRRGRFRLGAIICYRATARPKCSSSHECFLEKLFSPRVKAATTRKREGGKWKCRRRSIDRKKCIFSLFFFFFLQKFLRTILKWTESRFFKKNCARKGWVRK